MFWGENLQGKTDSLWIQPIVFCECSTWCFILLRFLVNIAGNVFEVWPILFKHGLKSDYLAKIAHKIAKSKYFPDIYNDSDSPINSLSDDI